MNKFTFLTIGLLFTANISLSATLTPEEALARVSRGNIPMKISAVSEAELKTTRFEDGKPVIYLFSMGKDKGFMAVSANDNTKALLGYSSTGTINDSEQDIPDGMSYWLDCLGKEIATSGKYPKLNEADHYREEIKPMLKTTWDQGSPYNASCPVLNGSRTYTGCVATAMAQTLKYFSYPEKGFGTHSYVLNNTNLSFNYEATTFNWDDMLDSYSGAYTSVQQKEVAQLMLACGIGVDMRYTANGSGAVFFNAVRALIENFGYDKGLRYYERNYFNFPDWEDMIYDNLKNYGPVLYGGNNMSSGHAFVCDGYKDGYYHFNWGWSGISDGYFLLTALDPDMQGIGGSNAGYNFNQHIITRMKTEHTSEFAFEELVGVGDMTLGMTTAKTGGSTYANLTFYSYSYETLTNPEIGFEIMTKEGETVTFITSVIPPVIAPTYGLINANLPIPIPEQIESGEYIIRPAFICKEGSNILTPIMMPVANRGYYNMRVDGNNVTFTPEATADLKTENFKIDTELYLNASFKATAEIRNDSEKKEFYNSIAVAAYDGKILVATGDVTVKNILPGETVELDYISSLTKLKNANIENGKSYSLYVCTVDADDNYTIISDAVEKKIHTATNAIMEVDDLKITVEDNKKITASARVTCDEGYFAGSLPLYIMPSTGGSYINYYYSNFFTVSANETEESVSDTAEIDYDFYFSLGKEGTEYLAGIYYKGNWISEQVPFVFSKDSGISDFSDENEVLKREYISVTGFSVESKPTAPGIYVIIEKHADGTVKTCKTVIR